MFASVTLCNSVDRRRRFESSFFIDPQSADCVVGAIHLFRIGIMPITKRRWLSPDGSEAVTSAGMAVIEFDNDLAGVTVVFGQDDCTPVLGLTALQSLGIEIDERTNRITRRRAVRLKAI
jgi:hypothetical protein